MFPGAPTLFQERNISPWVHSFQQESFVNRWENLPQCIMEKMQVAATFQTQEDAFGNFPVIEPTQFAVEQIVQENQGAQHFLCSHSLEKKNWQNHEQVAAHDQKLHFHSEYSAPV